MALNDEQLEIISEALLPLFQYLEKEVIIDVARRIKKTLTYTRTAELQAMSMRELGYSPAKIRKEAMKLLNSDKEFRKAVAKNTLEYKRDIRKLINDITKEAYKANNEIVAGAGNMSWIDDLSVWKDAGKELGDNSFLQQLVDTFTAQTAGELKNMTQTTGFKTMSGFEAVENVYKRELDKAVIKICSGTFSTDKVVNDVVHDLAQSGLRSIDFSSGYSMQLDTAARLAIRTGCHQMAAKVTDKNMEQSGENLVYVSKHWGARNTGIGHANHEQWQGKVYFIKDGTNYSEEAKRIGQDRITSLWYATGYSADGAYENDPLGLNGYNCRHHHYVWFEGVSELPPEVPEPKPVTINGKTYDYYAMTQKMRSMERGIRALKREKEALGKLGMDTAEVQAKIHKKTSEYHQFCRDVGIRAKDNRLRYEAGTSELKKTEAWKNFKVPSSGVNEIKKIDFGKLKNVHYSRKVSKFAMSEEDGDKVEKAITNVAEDYDIRLDIFEVGNYTEKEYRTVPMFFAPVDDNGVFKTKLVINNASIFWRDKEIQRNALSGKYFAAETIEELVEHELAHVLTFQNCKTLQEYSDFEDILHNIKDGYVSRYSRDCEDGAETMAEAFVLVRKGKAINQKALKLLNTYIGV